MKPLYITSIEPYSGKTAACLALGMRFQADGYQVGYLKPLSLQPWRVGDHIADEDAAFVKEILGLAAESWELSPIVITPEYLRDCMDTFECLPPEGDPDRLQQVRAAFDAASAGQDVLLLEGGGSLREGYVVGLPTPLVAQHLNSKALAIVKYSDEVRTLDDALTAQYRLGSLLSGVILNRIPEDANTFVNKTAIPYLEGKGIPVLGALPDVHSLAALTVGEIVQALNAEVLTKYLRPQALVENLTIGAMTADTALSRFRKYAHKAVITGGDRTDIQLAALETSTTLLILTGNLRPSPLVVRQAEEFGVAILLVPGNTLETVEAIERLFGKTRLGHSAKLKTFQNLLDEHFDFGRLYPMLGLK
ncbi:MAG: phosphotransacetylase family protein [Chloroflexota bacterium]